MRLNAAHICLLIGLYSFWGYLLDSCVLSAQRKKFVNSGFLNMPFMPFYGISVITASALLWYTDSPLIIFLASAILNCVLQYFTGLLSEVVFGIRFQDYSYHRFNIHGRVNFFAVPVNAAGITLLLLYVHEFVVDALTRLSAHAAAGLAAALVLLIGFDALSVVRHLARLNALLAALRKIRFYSSAIQARVRYDLQKNRRLFNAFPRMRHMQYSDSLRKVRQVLETRN